MSPIQTYRRYLNAVLPALAVVLIGFLATSVPIFPSIESVSVVTELQQERAPFGSYSITQFDQANKKPLKADSSTVWSQMHFNETLRSFRAAITVKVRVLREMRNSFNTNSYLSALLKVSENSSDPYHSYCLS